MGNNNSIDIDILCIPYLKHDKINDLNIDRSKINKYVLHTFDNCIDTDEIPCVIINPNHGLTSKELDIAKGIILANGINYFETIEEIDYYFSDEEISNQIEKALK